jgi:hypothetical protein
VGEQQAGDVGVAQSDVPIYLVLQTKGQDEMLIADNQQPMPHSRFASGKEKTRTAYFLRAPNDPSALFATRLKETIATDPDYQTFFPNNDEQTDFLRGLPTEQVGEGLRT